MAPKMEIQKIDDKKRCQIIFSKRRAAFKKQAKEFSIWCDVDLAYVVISPCGRVHKFSTKTSIENVLHRYVNLPVGERLSQLSNAEEMAEKLQKLRLLEHIEGDGEKFNHLEKQIENLEQEMQKKQEEIKCLDDDLRNYEPYLEKQRFLHRFLWSERRVKQSWERVTLRKKAVLSSRSYSLTSSSDGQPSSQVRTSRSSIPKIRTSQVGQRQPRLTEINYDMMDLTETGTERLLPVSHNNKGKELVISCSLAQNPSSNHNEQLLIQLNPWISPYSSKHRESIVDELSGEGKGKQIAYEATAAAGTSNFHIQGFPTMPSQQNSAQDALKAFPQSHIPLQVMQSDSSRPFAVAEPQLPSTLWQQGAMQSTDSSRPFAVAEPQLPSTLWQQGAMQSDSSRPFAVAEPQLPSTLWQQGGMDFRQKTPIGLEGIGSPIAGLETMHEQQGNSLQGNVPTLEPTTNIQMQKTPIGARGAGLSSMEYHLGNSARTRGAIISPSNNTIQMQQSWKANQSQSSFLNQPLLGQKTPIGVQGADLPSMGQLGNSAGSLIPTSNNTIQMQGINPSQNPPIGIQGHQADFGQIAPLGVQQHPPLTFDNNMISPLGVQHHQPQTFDHNMQDIIIGNNTSFGVDDVSLLSPPTLGQQGHGGMVGQMSEFNFDQEQLNSFSGGNNNLFNSLEAHPLSNLDHRTEQNQVQPPPHGIVFDNPPAPLKIDLPPPAHQNSSVGPVSEVNGLVANPSWMEGMQDSGLWEWEELHAQVGQGVYFP